LSTSSNNIHIYRTTGNVYWILKNHIWYRSNRTECCLWHMFFYFLYSHHFVLRDTSLYWLLLENLKRVWLFQFKSVNWMLWSLILPLWTRLYMTRYYMGTGSQIFTNNIVWDKITSKSFFLCVQCTAAYYRYQLGCSELFILTLNTFKYLSFSCYTQQFMHAHATISWLNVGMDVWKIASLCRSLTMHLSRM